MKLLLYTQKFYTSRVYIYAGQNSVFFFNLLSLVLKARHLNGPAFWNFYRLGVLEQALSTWALVVLWKINLLNIHTFSVVV